MIIIIAKQKKICRLKRRRETLKIVIGLGQKLEIIFTHIPGQMDVWVGCVEEKGEEGQYPD